MKMLYIIIGAIATNVFAAPIWPSVTNVFTPISFGFLDTSDGPSYNILTNTIVVTNLKKNGNFSQTTTLSDGNKWDLMRTSNAIPLTLPNNGASASTFFDSKGIMFIADYINHIIYTYNEKYGLTEIVNAKELGIIMNQPNDMAISSAHIIYASDPDWVNNTGNIWVFKSDSAGKYQILQQISANTGTTNGIELSPDEKTLYVNETVQRVIYSFTILPDGSLSNKKTIVANTMGDVDAMKTDNQGNLYVITRKTDDLYPYYGVMVYSPFGKLLADIKTLGNGISRGFRPSNLTFAGSDGKTVIVTMQDETWSGAGYIDGFQNPFAGRQFR